MRNAPVLAAALMIIFLSGCVTTGYIASDLTLDNSVSYWNGTTYIRIDPGDYYYYYNGHYYHHHHSRDTDIIVIAPPRGYNVINGRPHLPPNYSVRIGHSWPNSQERPPHFKPTLPPLPPPNPPVVHFEHNNHRHPIDLNHPQHLGPPQRFPPPHR